MSKIGKKPVEIPASVKVELDEKEIKFSGPVGQMNLLIPKELKIEINGDLVHILADQKIKEAKMMQGTFRQLIFNALKGVSEGWEKGLEVKGTGFKVNKEGEILVLTLGFSHPVKISPPEGIKFEVKENLIFVRGANKALVGLVADQIRKIYPPDAYKGKGIRYQGEKIILKPGKSAKTGSSVGGGK